MLCYHFLGGIRSFLAFAVEVGTTCRTCTNYGPNHFVILLPERITDSCVIISRAGIDPDYSEILFILSSKIMFETHQVKGR